MSENDVANCRGCSSDPEGDEGPRIAVHLEPEGGEGDDGSELDGGEDEDKAIGGRYFVGGTGGNQRCFNCGLPGHFSKECPETNVREFECFSLGLD